MNHDPIFSIVDRANELRAAGADVIDLAAGEPGGPTPPHIVAAAERALHDAGNHHYGLAAGLPALREAVAERVRQSLQSSWHSEDVVITLGAKHALYLALSAIVDAGDRVIVAQPCWPGHRGAVVAAGGVVGYAETSIESGFLVTPEALEAAWRPQTRAAIIASPANPTGGVYAADQWSAIAQWAQRREVWLITDDVYDELVYEGDHTPLLAAVPGLRDQCIMVNSVSKAHNMTGWRVGWLAGPREIVEAATKTVTRTITHAPQIMQAAALEAVRGDQIRLEATRRAYRARRDRIHAALNAVSGISCILPTGGMFVFPCVATLLQDNSAGLSSSSDLAAWLLDEVHVAVVPGEAFQAPAHLRINFTVEDDALDEAATWLQSALRSITGCHSRSEACAVPYARRDRLEAGLFVSIPSRADARPLQ